MRATKRPDGIVSVLSSGSRTNNPTWGGEEVFAELKNYWVILKTPTQLKTETYYPIP